MKRLVILTCMFLTALAAGAQTTVVSATVTDSDTTPWANGTWSLTFAPNPQNPNVSQYNINGSPLSSSVLNQAGSMDGSANFSITMYDSTTITPTGSGWILNVCPQATAACGVLNFSTAGSTMNISAVLTATIPAPRFKPVAGAYGYIDLEAQIQTVPGSTYYNVQVNCQKYYNAQTASFACGGGGGGTGVADVPITIPSLTIPSSQCFGSASTTTPTTFVMTGVTTSMGIAARDSTNPSGVTGYGASGGLNVRTWASATNQGSWLVCNTTGLSITGSSYPVIMVAQ